MIIFDSLLSASGFAWLSSYSHNGYILYLRRFHSNNFGLVELEAWAAPPPSFGHETSGYYFTMRPLVVDALPLDCGACVVQVVKNFSFIHFGVNLWCVSYSINIQLLRPKRPPAVSCVLLQFACRPSTHNHVYTPPSPGVILWNSKWATKFTKYLNKRRFMYHTSNEGIITTKIECVGIRHPLLWVGRRGW